MYSRIWFFALTLFCALAMSGCVLFYIGCDDDECESKLVAKFDAAEKKTLEAVVNDSVFGRLVKHFYGESPNPDRPIDGKLRIDVQREMNSILRQIEKKASPVSKRLALSTTKRKAPLRAESLVIASGLNTISGHEEGNRYLITIDQRVLEAMLRSSILQTSEQRVENQTDSIAKDAQKINHLLDAEIHFLDAEIDDPFMKIWTYADAMIKFRATLQFALAHEYGHLLMDHNARAEKALSSCKEYKQIEVEADWFAANVAFAVAHKYLLIDNPLAMAEAQTKDFGLTNEGAFFRSSIGSETFLIDSFVSAGIQMSANCKYPSASDRLALVESNYKESTKTISTTFQKKIVGLKALFCLAAEEPQCTQDGVEIRETDLTKEQRSSLKCLKKCNGRNSCECNL